MIIGVPIKLLHEAEGHTVKIELKSGEIYQGQLVDAEDNMNCHLKGILYTARDGRQTKLDRCYIRGSKVRFFILPDMLKNAPMFKVLDNKSTGKGMGRGAFAGSDGKSVNTPSGRGGGRGGGGRGGGRGRG